MKDNLGVPLEIMGSLVRVTRESAGSGGWGELVFLFNESCEKGAESSKRRACGKSGSFQERDSSWLGPLSFRSFNKIRQWDANGGRAGVFGNHPNSRYGP